jgi:hypothetical protein
MGLKIIRLNLCEDMLENPSLVAGMTGRWGDRVNLLLDLNSLPMSRISAELIRFDGPPNRNLETVKGLLDKGAFRFYLKSDNWRYPEVTDRIIQCGEGDLEIAERLSGREVLTIYLEGRRDLSPLRLDSIRPLIEEVSLRVRLDSVHLIAPKLLNASIISSLTLPWDDGLPDLFKRISGEDLFERLPYLFITTHETLGELGRFWEIAGTIFYESAKKLGCGVALPLLRKSLLSAVIPRLPDLPAAMVDEGGDLAFRRRALLVKLVSSSKGATGFYPSGEIKTSDVLLGLERAFGNDRRMEEHLRRLISLTQPEREILLIYPTSSILGTPDDRERDRTIERLAELAFDLIDMGYDFDLIPEPMLEVAMQRGYRVVIIPSCQTLTSGTVKTLRGLAKRRRLAAVHPPPYLVDGMGDERAFELEEMLWGKVKIIEEPWELERFLSEAVRRRINLYERLMNYPARSILVQHRSGENSDLFIMMNLRGGVVNVLVEIGGEFKLEEIRADGSTSEIGFWHADGRTYAEATLEGGRMMVLRAS